jgi:hypothetical protein
MNSRPGIKSGLINEEIDFQAFLRSLIHKPFAISPPIEFENSFIMGLANEDLHEGLCIHIPLPALSEVPTLLFVSAGRDTPVYVHSLKQLINWFYKRNIMIARDRFRDVSAAAYLLKPPESDKGEDWQTFF